MAVISCSKCGKEVEASMSACPYCGSDLSGDGLQNFRQTRASEKVNSPKTGTATLVGGIVFALSGLISTSLVGLLVMAVGIALIFDGVRQIRGTLRGPCPYCGEEVSVKINAKTFHCPHCGKTGEKQGEILRCVE